MRININRSLLVKARYAKGLSAPDLAKLAEVAVSTVISIECGRRLPSPKTLAKMCAVLDVDTREAVEIVA